MIETVATTSVVDEELRRRCEEVALNSPDDRLLESPVREDSLF